ncbi:MAG: DUF5684 domain-containing protein [Bdellovibrionota bacterium]
MEATQAGQGSAIIGIFITLVFILFCMIAMWKVYVKAGKPGWGILIPIYNSYLLVKIAGRPGWWVLLFFTPLVNVVISIILSIDIAIMFGKGAGFGMGLIMLPLIFYPILAFGSAVYMPKQPVA